MPAEHVTEPRTSEIAIFGRLLSNGKGVMSRELTRYVLTLGFSEDDQVRLTDLAERNQAGGLSAEEHEELLNFVGAGHPLALLHARARTALQKKKTT